METLVIGLLLVIAAANGIIGLRALRTELAYRRAVKRRLKTYASLYDAVIDQER